MGKCTSEPPPSLACLPTWFTRLVNYIHTTTDADGGDGGDGDNNTRSNNRTAVTVSDIDAHTAPDGRECNASSLAPIFVIAAVASVVANAV